MKRTPQKPPAKMDQEPSLLRMASGPGMEMRLRAHLQSLVELVEKHGWTCLSVFGSEDGEEPFTCTLGAKGVGLPDLIIMGLSNAGIPILNSILNAAKNGLVLAEDVKYTQFANLPLMLKHLTTEQTSAHMLRTTWYYRGEPFEAFQVVYPDPAGRFPWEEAYDCPSQAQLWVQ